MNEFIQHIAEVEGVRTPKRKRSQKEIDTAFSEYTEKRSSKAKPKRSAKRSAKGKSQPKARSAKLVQTPAAIVRLPINNDGYTRSAGYDEKSKLMHVEFAANVYEFDGIAKNEWNAWRKTFEDPETNSGEFFRRNFKKRSFRKIRPVVSKETASVKEEK